MFADVDQRFLKAQWQRIAAAVLLGAAVGMVAHLFTRDQTFGSFIHAEWVAFPAKWHFDGFRAYKLEAITACVGIVVLSLVPTCQWLLAFARAWWAGIASLFIPAVAFSVFAAVTWGPTHSKLVSSAGVSLVLGVFGAELWRRIKPPSSSDGKLKLNLPVTKQGASAEQRWRPSTSDDPITNWDQDAIGRTAVVELLADHALRQRSPIVALHGDLGDGKSSVLNLLRLAVAGQAIVVFFSAWLPGSDVTLSTDLFADIATECRKYVRAPRLRKAALAYARAIGGSVPHLAGLKELLPAQSQRDDIENLREALRRLPLRILVLIDEIDRMQQGELLVLLKVLRGAFTIPNVTFVCAFSEKHVTDELKESRDYLEKFFPVSVSLSAPSGDLVGKLFQAHLTKEFVSQKWFMGNEDEAKFRKLLQELWQDALASLCTNLRQASILLNDIFTAARPIIREVDPFDLVAIEAVRRFYPLVYRLVKANRAYLTPGSNTWAKYEYLSDEEKTKGTKRLAEEVEQAITAADKPAAVQALLKWLFPYYENVVDQRRRYQAYVRPTNEDISEREKRICAADYFSVYFRGQFPRRCSATLSWRRCFLS